MGRMLIYSGTKTDKISMATNIIGTLETPLLDDIMSKTFEPDWRSRIHPDQKGAANGERIIFMEYMGKAGWFRIKDGGPTTKENPLYHSPGVYLGDPPEKGSIQTPNLPGKINFNPPPVPVTYNTTRKSTLSFLTRLFRL